VHGASLLSEEARRIY